MSNIKGSKISPFSSSYKTRGNVKRGSIPASCLSLSLTISACNNPKKPTLKPVPKNMECSDDMDKEASFNEILFKASRK